MALDYDEWMTYGIKKGWCGPPVCYTHDGLPMSEQEDVEFGEGQDPCIHIVRMYEDVDTKKEIESSRSPTQWRNAYIN